MMEVQWFIKAKKEIHRETREEEMGDSDVASATHVVYLSKKTRKTRIPAGSSKKDT